MPPQPDVHKSQDASGGKFSLPSELADLGGSRWPSRSTFAGMPYVLGGGAPHSLMIAWTADYYLKDGVRGNQTLARVLETHPVDREQLSAVAERALDVVHQVCGESPEIAESVEKIRASCPPSLTWFAPHKQAGGRPCRHDEMLIAAAKSGQLTSLYGSNSAVDSWVGKSATRIVNALDEANALGGESPSAHAATMIALGPVVMHAHDVLTKKYQQSHPDDHREFGVLQELLEPAAFSLLSSVWKTVRARPASRETHALFSAYLSEAKVNVFRIPASEEFVPFAETTRKLYGLRPYLQHSMHVERTLENIDVFATELARISGASRPLPKNPEFAFPVGAFSVIRRTDAGTFVFSINGITRTCFAGFEAGPDGKQHVLSSIGDAKLLVNRVQGVEVDDSGKIHFGLRSRFATHSDPVTGRRAQETIARVVANEVLSLVEDERLTTYFHCADILNHPIAVIDERTYATPHAFLFCKSDVATLIELESGKNALKFCESTKVLATYHVEADSTYRAIPLNEPLVVRRRLERLASALEHRAPADQSSVFSAAAYFPIGELSLIDVTRDRIELCTFNPDTSRYHVATSFASAAEETYTYGANAKLKIVLTKGSGCQIDANGLLYAGSCSMPVVIPDSERKIVTEKLHRVVGGWVERLAEEWDEQPALFFHLKNLGHVAIVTTSQGRFVCFDKGVSTKALETLRPHASDGFAELPVLLSDAQCKVVTNAAGLSGARWRVAQIWERRHEIEKEPESTLIPTKALSEERKYRQLIHEAFSQIRNYTNSALVADLVAHFNVAFTTSPGGSSHSTLIRYDRSGKNFLGKTIMTESNYKSTSPILIPDLYRKLETLKIPKKEFYEALRKRM